MEILTSEEFVSAVIDDHLDCRVIVGKDFVKSYQRDDDGEEMEYGERWKLIFDFDGKGPKGVLVDLLLALGVDAELEF